MPSQKAYTYLFDSEPSSYEVERFNTKRVRVALPVYGETLHREFEVPYDERDLRALVAFDGDIPWGGLPRSGAVAFHECICHVEVDKEHVRKQREHEDMRPRQIYERGPKVVLALHRYFLLLPSSATLVRRYRPESLSAMYALVQVTRKDGGTQIIWRNSSY